MSHVVQLRVLPTFQNKEHDDDDGDGDGLSDFERSVTFTINDSVTENVNSLKNVTVGIYLDLQKAFDTVDHGILLHKLYVYGIRGITLDWFRDYLRNRQQFVTL